MNKLIADGVEVGAVLAAIFYSATYILKFRLSLQGQTASDRYKQLNLLELIVLKLLLGALFTLFVLGLLYNGYP